MPGLQAFCVCTALSLGAIYLLQMTWFVAWMYLDEKRIQSQRNGLLPCLSFPENKPSSCSSSNWGQRFLHKYETVLPSLSFRVCVLLATSVLTILGICGCILIRQKFDYLLLLPADSYLRQWHDMRNQLYPDKGWSADVYTGSFDFSDLHTFENLTNSLEELKQTSMYIQGEYKICIIIFHIFFGRL